MISLLLNKRMTLLAIIPLTFIVLIAFIFKTPSDDAVKISEKTLNHNDVVKPENISNYSSHAEHMEHINKTDLDSQNNTIQQCEHHCLTLLSKLTKGGNLSASDLSFIMKNSAVFANKLKDIPEAMAELLSALQDDEDSEINKHDAAYAIVEALSIEDKTQVASLISLSENSNDRLSALTLLREGIKFDNHAVDAFISILSAEQNPTVQIMAINMAKQVSGEQNQEKARNALDNIIQTHESDYSSGEALLAKISISPSPSLVAQDVYDLVSSFSTGLQLYGLQAFETSMERYNAEFDAGKGWQEHTLIKQSILAIAQDNSADTAHRNKAQEILERFF